MGIFFIGSGVTVYHGIMGLFHPPSLTLLPAVREREGGREDHDIVQFLGIWCVDGITTCGRRYVPAHLTY